MPARSELIWTVATTHPNLSTDQVHVWRIELNRPETERERLWPLLSPEEKQQADRFHFPNGKNHYVVCRGTVRLILAGYLQINPSEVRFQVGPFGKPSLKIASRTKVEFNVSHSHGLALLAVSAGRPLGVDLEQVRVMDTYEQIAVRYFSPIEVKRLRQMADHEKPEAFFSCWSRKEAFVKATGQGISYGLDQFSVPLSLHDPNARFVPIDCPHETTRWRMCTLIPAPNFVGAIVAAGDNWDVSAFALGPSSPACVSRDQ